MGRYVLLCRVLNGSYCPGYMYLGLGMERTVTIQGMLRNVGTLRTSPTHLPSDSVNQQVAGSSPGLATLFH